MKHATVYYFLYLFDNVRSKIHVTSAFKFRFWNIFHRFRVQTIQVGLVCNLQLWFKYFVRPRVWYLVLLTLRWNKTAHLLAYDESHVMNILHCLVIYAASELVFRNRVLLICFRGPTAGKWPIDWYCCAYNVA